HLRRATTGGERETRQLFISEAEILSILDTLLGSSTVSPDAAETDPIDTLIARLVETKAERLEKTKEKDSFPLLMLGRIFGLTPFDIDLLIMALAV
ncbi:MAG: hypothetical protein ACM3ON_11810, partial [Chloroflexota bacterium]